MGVNEDTQSNSELTLEMFREIFEKIEPDVEIAGLEKAPGSGRGDNYTATLHRVRLTGYRKAPLLGDKSLKWEKSVICKRLPTSMVRREAFKSDNLFRNEVEFYTKIIPTLVEFGRVQTGEVFKAVPQCYLARNDILIMEDLRTRGFKMPDRIKGLTVEETIAVLKEIANYHSLNLAFKFQNQKQFQKLRNLITEGIFCPSNEDWYRKYYEQLTRNAIKMVSDVLPPDSKYLEKLRNFAESSTFFSRMIELVNMESPLSVICHGDCWANNFLYKYIEEGKVNETNLVDFQLVRYGSVAMDVSNIIFCCTSKLMRDEHMNSFIEIYTSELYKHLKALGPLPEFCDSLDKCHQLFNMELKTFGKFGLGLAMDIIPISTCSSEDAPDLYIERSEEATGAPELNFPPNDLCRQKMTEILIDLVDLEML